MTRRARLHVGALPQIVQRLVSHPAIYDIVQVAAGANRVRNWLAPCLAETSSCTLLDVGAGTGAIRSYLPSDAAYIWLDNDSRKLPGYRTMWPNSVAVLADASQLCFATKSVDYALCMAATHHLPDEQLDLLLEEMSRVVRRRLFLLDALDCPSRLLSAAMWVMDRGSYPRTEAKLQHMISKYFVILQSQRLEILHRYLLCIGTPTQSVASEGQEMA